MSLLAPVACVIDEFNIGPLNVERRGPRVKNATYGYDAAPATTVVLDPVSAHNVTGRDLEQVPEADRNSEVVQFYTKVRLFVADGGQSADVVTYNARRFRIIRVQDFALQAGVFCCFGALEDTQAVA